MASPSPEVPFFHARTLAHRVAVSGVTRYLGGHRLQDGDGVFGEWIWDGVQLQVRSDRYSTYPLFYFVTPGEICVSPSLLTLLAEGAPAAPDFDALAAFLRLGFFLGEDTPVRSIRALPPNAHLVWRDGVLRISGGLSFATAVQRSRDEAIDEFLYLFRRSIRRRLVGNGRVLLPLSGGRDSRHILLALVEAGAPPDACVTVRPFPPRQHLEVPIAAAVSRLAGVPHVVIEQQARRVEAERRKNLMTHFCSDEHAHFLALADYLSLHASTSYDGLAGDMLTGQSGAFEAVLVELLDDGQFETAAERLFVGYEKRGIEDALRRMLARDFYACVSPSLAVSRVTRELARHGAAPNRALSFLFWNRTRRELALAPYAMMSGVTVFSPYVDHALFDLLMGLPPPMLLDHSFHTDAIARGYPAAREIPFEHGDSSVMPDMFFRIAALDLASTVIRSRAALRRRYLLPRLAMAVVTGRPKYVWFLPLSVYMSQLDAYMRVAADGALP